jgi:hypothetical protein
LFSSVAVILSICTENETTLAIGASVPTTNDDPCCTVGVTGPDPVVPPPPQPAITNAAAMLATTPTGKDLKSLLEFICVPFLSRTGS